MPPPFIGICGDSILLEQRKIVQECNIGFEIIIDQCKMETVKKNGEANRLFAEI
jgi:hypothetical protein